MKNPVRFSSGVLHITLYDGFGGLPIGTIFAAEYFAENYNSGISVFFQTSLYGM